MQSASRLYLAVARQLRNFVFPPGEVSSELTDMKAIVRPFRPLLAAPPPREPKFRVFVYNIRARALSAYYLNTRPRFMNVNRRKRWLDSLRLQPHRH